MSVDTNTNAMSGASIEGCDDILLCVRDLSVGHGDPQVFTDVDVDVFDGEYVAIVSPNGTDKSTTMRSVSGLTAHIGGTVRFKDGDTTGRRPEDAIHVGVGYVPQNSNIFPMLTIEKDLEMDAYILNRASQGTIEAIYEQFPVLREWKDQKAGTISGGQQQMPTIGHAFMLDPDLLLLNKSSAGLVPDLVKEMFDKIDEINKAGTAVLMVEQGTREAFQCRDRSRILVNGRNRYMDIGTALLEDGQVRQDFLGDQPVSTVHALFGQSTANVFE